MQVVIRSSSMASDLYTRYKRALCFGTFATCVLVPGAYVATVAPARSRATRGAIGGERSGSTAGAVPAAGLRGRRQGAEEERDRLRLQRRHRRRLDRAGLQPRRDARLRRRRRRPAGAGDPADQLHPDVPRRRRLLLHEQSRPGLRHQLLLGDQGDGPAARLDRRLGDRRRRHHRDGQPGPDRRPLHLRAVRPGQPRPNRPSP